MKRIYLQKVVQHSTVSYVGSMDVRDILKVSEIIERGKEQEAQRPLKEAKLKSIAKHVDEGGILPGSLVLAILSTSKLKIDECILKDDKGNEIKQYYMEFPTTDAELKEYVGSLEALDGQHRLYSFSDDICTLSDDADFDISFTVYEKPSLNERRKVFLVCNEKQEKVATNLIVWFKEKLNMLSTDEKTLRDVVTKLNQSAPLEGKIIMGAETIKGGVKAQQLMDVLKKSGVMELSNPVDDTFVEGENLAKIISNYLLAWEDVVGFQFTSPNHKLDGAATKIAGLRFMFDLLPSFWRRSINTQKGFERAFCKETIEKMIDSFGTIPRDQFFTCEEHKMCFRERSATEQLAKICENKVNSLGSEKFNPLANI